MDIKSTSNFSFLAEHDPLFLELAIGAERAFSSDPDKAKTIKEMFGLCFNGN